MIAWKYLNKQRATLNALSDYKNIERVIEITPNEIKSITDNAADPRNSASDGLPHSRNIRSGENLLCNVIDHCDVLFNRYLQAQEFMSWFEPAWSTLPDDEQRILKEFYMTGNQRSGATAWLRVELNFSETHIERLRNKALSRLTLMLFGKQPA